MKRHLPAYAAIATALVGLLGQAPAVAAAGGVPYIALGDSYSAGVGAPPNSGTCQRSPLSFPTLLATAIKQRFYLSEACSGATSTTVVAGQLTALGPYTGLVTLTAGGNDVDFGTGIAVCLQGTDADCVAATQASEQKAVDVLPAQLDALYAAVRHRAPAAELAVFSYPRFFELTDDCDVAPLSLTKRAAMNHAADLLDTVIADRVAAAGATFIDVRALFTGHGACGTRPWMNGLTATGAFHPHADGYRSGYLAAALTVLG